MSRLYKYALLSALYFAQGLPFGFFVQALPVLLREQGLSLSAIGGTYFLALPWALKFLWAPFVDAHHVPGGRGHRYRGWILAMQLCAALLMVACGQLDPQRHLPAVLACVLLTNLFAATQDIATDALCVRLLNHEERGVGNGIQVAGYRVGMITGGGAILIAYPTIGWRWSFLLMAGLLALSTTLLWRDLPADDETPAVDEKERTQAFDWWRFIRREGMPHWLLLLVLFKAPDAFATGMVRPLMVDVGFSLDDIGWLMGGFGFVTALLGALFGGWLAGRWGRVPTVLSMGALQVLALCSYIPPAWLGGAFVEAPYFAFALSVDHFFGGAATAAVFTMMMDRAAPATAGSDYTIQASVVVLATGTFSAAAGVSADVLGHTGHIVLGTAVSTLGLLYVAHSLRQQKDRQGDRP